MNKEKNIFSVLKCIKLKDVFLTSKMLYER